RQTNIRSGLHQVIIPKASMPEVLMTARAVNHRSSRLADHLDIRSAQVVRVNNEEPLAEKPVFLRELDWRTATAIAPRALPFQPIVERSATIREHRVLRLRFGQVRAQQQIALPSEFRALAYKLRRGRVKRVRRKPNLLAFILWPAFNPVNR